MVKGRKNKGRKVVPVPVIMMKQEAKKLVNPLLEERSKNFGIRQDIQPKRDSHPLCQMALLHLAAEAKGYLFSISV